VQHVRRQRLTGTYSLKLVLSGYGALREQGPDRVDGSIDEERDVLARGAR
jgi:hypothetical protein